MSWRRAILVGACLGAVLHFGFLGMPTGARAQGLEPRRLSPERTAPAPNAQMRRMWNLCMERFQFLQWTPLVPKMEQPTPRFNMATY